MKKRVTEMSYHKQGRWGNGWSWSDAMFGDMKQ